MLIKTTDLTSRALDWAVGVAVGENISVRQAEDETYVIYSGGFQDGDRYSPTTRWGQLGPLMEKYVWKFKSGPFGCDAYVFHNGENTLRTGGNIAEATCRAIVASKLGDQVDVPEVLCQ